MQVPYFDFNLAPKELHSEWEKAVLESIFEFDFVLGKSVSKFEEAWSRFVGIKHSVGVGNGFDGLLLGLHAMNLPRGFTVAVPAHTFIASWNAVHFAGGIPIGIDVDTDGLMNLSQLEQLSIIPDVVMPVHMHGRMVDMQRIKNWSIQKNVLTIEDASQAHGAKFQGISAGAWADVSVFSLYPSKNLGAFGDAGIVCTNDDAIATRLKSLRNYGATKSNKYNHESMGVNSRLDSLQASVLNVNLRYLKDWNFRRYEIAQRYLAGLDSNPKLKLPRDSGNEMVWHHFTILHEERDKLKSFMTNNSVQTEIHYPKPAGVEFAKILDGRESFPVAEKLSESILSLPISPWHSNAQIDHVIETVNAFQHE